MADPATSREDSPDLQELLGYLNFSSGTTDPLFLKRLNGLFGQLCPAEASPGDIPAVLFEALTCKLDRLAAHSPAFADAEQARGVLRLALREFPARYRAFHRDLLFHQPDAALWRPLFLGRVFEAILEQGGPWDENDRILDGAIATLNDFIGYRPVAVLRTAQRLEPYAHEWIRPIPLYVRGVGTGVGPYQVLVERAWEILVRTDPNLLREAYFDPEALDELALDPRAYDFDHPVNKRPNYHFGQWDPHRIDLRGQYRRFVVQQVTLDVLLERCLAPGELDADEVLWEAAAVLAGTMLMASGTSGNGPQAHDSTASLSTLLPKIAAYRDTFYDQFVQQIDGQHGERLRAEAIAGKQPLAGARQHLNQQLARRRAAQLERVHLALMFARMGYPQAALRQAQIVSVAAARMTCEIQCRITTGHRAIDAGRLAEASALLVEAEDFLKRGIECGALVDPWNILGFHGQFSLFPAPENSVPDHRIDQLLDVMGQIIGLYARLWSDAAVHAAGALEADLAERMSRLTTWWDQFAASTVEDIEAFSGGEAFDSAQEVAKALGAFRQAGSAAGDIAFWRKRVSHFNSPKAYALVVDALWQKPDLVAAMALLMQWLSSAGMIPLREGEYSFHTLAERWLTELFAAAESGAEQGTPLVQKFFDLLEANAEDFWQVPSLDLLGLPAPRNAEAGKRHDDEDYDDEDYDNDDDDDDADEDDSDSEGEGLYSAAYDEMVYIDSTGDGVEGDMLESGAAPATDFELELESRRLGERLAFLRTVAVLWKRAGLACGPCSADALKVDTLERWIAQGQQNERQLLALARAVESRPIPAPSSARDSLMEFERRRSVKDALVDKIINTLIETGDAVRWLRALLPDCGAERSGGEEVDLPVLGEVMQAVVLEDGTRLRTLWPTLLETLRSQPLLYVPLAKGGDAAQLVRAKSLEQALFDLVVWLPRLGLLRETCQLIETVRLMESANPVGPGAISEYDRLFTAGYEAIVDALVDFSQAWPATGDDSEPDSQLVECLEQLTESLLKQWLAHSRTLRLSSLERIGDEKNWKAIVAFIERYGHDLFTQRFLGLGNLRAILHQGVGAWLQKLAETPEADETPGLIEDLDKEIPLAAAVKHLSLIIEAVAENYGEYRDYNSTTTQSDRGELLYTLLDFLRLRVHYDRIAWHLKPVIISHWILVRRGRTAAAEMWRRALADRTGELADKLQRKLGELRQKYAMRLPTVTDRLAERFTRPLSIDRVRALIKPAMEEVRQDQASEGGASLATFELLEQEALELAQEPTGVGLDVPGWLVSLEQEVEDVRRDRLKLEPPEKSYLPRQSIVLSPDEALRQLTDWEREPKV